MTASRKTAVVAAVLLAVCVALAVPASKQRPSARDDEVFLQAAYFVRTEGVSPIEGITRAAANQYGWGGDLAHRLRTQGDIQTYALVPVWSRIGGFRASPGADGRALYVDSPRLRAASFACFALAVLVLAWAVLPLGHGIALASALLLALGHPFRLGPTLFDVWVMPLAIASIGLWLRDRHELAATLAVLTILVKPNYAFLLPALGLAALVRPASPGRRPLAVYGVALAATVVAYLGLAAAHVIALGQYSSGVRSGYDPRVLAYSAVETVSMRYRAGTQQLRTSWPLFPWTAANVAALLALGFAAVRGAPERRRIGAALALLIGLPIVANFTVLPSVAAYEDGGHFRWINVSIIAMTIALPLGYREVATIVLARRRRRSAAVAA